MCDCDEKNINFGRNIYCKKCGMELGFKPAIKRFRFVTEYYCCRGCADT